MVEWTKQMKELELYIHIPFCVTKCDYCDFLSYSGKQKDWELYVTKLIEEIRFFHFLAQSQKVVSIYIGGGTPSILPEAMILRILNEIMDGYNVSATAEISIEANPGTLSEQKLRAYYKSGINRLSIGLQSADNEMLRMLGRIHTFEEFEDNYSSARNAGFRNINIDTMSALPGQSLGSYLQSMERILQLRPEHISAYSLIIEPETVFYNKYKEDVSRREKGLATIELPDEDLEYEIAVKTKEILTKNGYLQYEISNYAKKGFECRHNNGYWTRQNYLGFGLGAASLFDNVRFSNTKNLSEYLSMNFNDFVKDGSDLKHNFNQQIKGKKSEVQFLSKEQQMEEFMFLGLRRMAGVSVEQFMSYFGISIFEIYGNEIRTLMKQELLEEKQGYLLPTEKGLDLNNYVCASFLK